MNLSTPFVRRPIGTVLLTIGVALAGIAGFFVLPVSPLPQVDYPVISVSATIPGASPDTMASSVATPLERRLGTIAGVNEMTSQSSTSTTRVTLQFDLSAQHRRRGARGAGRHQREPGRPAHHLAQQPDLPQGQPGLGAGDHPGADLQDQDAGADLRRRLQHPEPAASRRSHGVGDVEIGGGSLPAVRIELLPFALNKYGISTEDVRAAIQAANATRPKGIVQGDGRRLQIYTQTPALKASGLRARWWSRGATARRCAWTTSPRWSTAWRTPAPSASSTANRRSWC